MLLRGRKPEIIETRKENVQLQGAPCLLVLRHAFSAVCVDSVLCGDGPAMIWP
jgi:hypothetical protein